MLTTIKVKSTSNNIILQTYTQTTKNITLSPGLFGFKGAKRSTPYAAQQTAEMLGKKLFENKITEVILIFKGFGKGKKSVIKGLAKKNIKIIKIIDKIMIPHNGCRLPKQRRR